MSPPANNTRQSKKRKNQRVQPPALADLVAVRARFNPLVSREVGRAHVALLRLSVAVAAAAAAAASSSSSSSSSSSGKKTKTAEEEEEAAAAAAAAALREAERLEGAYQRALADAGLLGAAAAIPALATHHRSMAVGGQTFAQLADAVVTAAAAAAAEEEEAEARIDLLAEAVYDVQMCCAMVFSLFLASTAAAAADV
jgi:hypothetical protein